MEQAIQAQCDVEIAKADEIVLAQARLAIQSARRKASTSINSAMVEAYWEIGRQINGAVGERAAYGKSC